MTYARVQFRWLSASASIIIHVIRCQWIPYIRDTSTFCTTNCFIHGVLLTGLSSFLVSNYKDMKLWYFIVLIKCTCLRADTTWYKHVRVMWNWSECIPPCHCRKCYQVIIITVLQCCTAALLIDLHVKPVLITAQLQFINILGTGVNSSLSWCFSHSMSILC